MCVLELSVDAPVFRPYRSVNWLWLGILDAARANLMVEGTILAFVQNITILLLANVAFDGLEVSYLEELNVRIEYRCGR